MYIYWLFCVAEKMAETTRHLGLANRNDLYGIAGHCPLPLR